MKSPSGDLLSLQTITWINKVISRCDATQDTEHQATLASLLMSQSSLRSRLDQLLLCSTLNWMSSSLFITLLTVQRYILSLWNNLVCWLCQTVHWHVQHSSFLISINVLWPFVFLRVYNSLWRRHEVALWLQLINCCSGRENLSRHFASSLACSHFQ